MACPSAMMSCATRQFLSWSACLESVYGAREIGEAQYLLRAHQPPRLPVRQGSSHGAVTHPPLRGSGRHQLLPSLLPLRGRWMMIEDATYVRA